MAEEENTRKTFEDELMTLAAAGDLESMLTTLATEDKQELVREHTLEAVEAVTTAVRISGGKVDKKCLDSLYSLVAENGKPKLFVIGSTSALTTQRNSEVARATYKGILPPLALSLVRLDTHLWSKIWPETITSVADFFQRPDLSMEREGENCVDLIATALTFLQQIWTSVTGDNQRENTAQFLVLDGLLRLHDEPLCRVGADGEKSPHCENQRTAAALMLAICPDLVEAAKARTLQLFRGDYNKPPLSSVGLAWAMYMDTCAGKTPPFALIPSVYHPLLLLDVAIDLARYPLELSETSAALAGSNLASAFLHRSGERTLTADWLMSPAVGELLRALVRVVSFRPEEDLRRACFGTIRLFHSGSVFAALPRFYTLLDSLAKDHSNDSIRAWLTTCLKDSAREDVQERAKGRDGVQDFNGEGLEKMTRKIVLMTLEENHDLLAEHGRLNTAINFFGALFGMDDDPTGLCSAMADEVNEKLIEPLRRQIPLARRAHELRGEEALSGRVNKDGMPPHLATMDAKSLADYSKSAVNAMDLLSHSLTRLFSKTYEGANTC